MTTPCYYEGVCRPDCQRRGDDCDGNIELMTEEEQKEVLKDEHICS